MTKGLVCMDIISTFSYYHYNLSKLQFKKKIENFEQLINL
jgi:hypothetical protein